MTQVYRTLRVAPSDGGVLGLVIDAPPMNLMTRDLARVFAGSKEGPNLEEWHMPTTTTPHVRIRTIDRVRTRYADTGSSHKPAAVLPGLWPESVYAFAPTWASLAEHGRLFGVGLPGFGASGCREDLLSPRAMGEFLAQLIADADLGAPRIVALDVGTAASAWGGEADG